MMPHGGNAASEGLTLRSRRRMLTLDLLVVSEPSDSGRRFAAQRGARQADWVALHGRLGESCDLRPSWHS